MADEKDKAKTPYPGMMGDGTEEQNLGQTGDPAARVTEEDVKEAFKDSSKTQDGPGTK